MSNRSSELKRERIPFTQIPNELIDDFEVSMQAKAIYCYLQSKPDNWIFYNYNIAKNMKTTEKLVSKYIKELKENGWITWNIKYKNGKISHKEYMLYNSKKLPVENHTVENHTVENHIHNNNNNNNNEFKNKENNKIHSERPKKDDHGEIFECFFLYLKGISDYTKRDHSHYDYENYEKVFKKIYQTIKTKKSSEASMAKACEVLGYKVAEYYHNYGSKGSMNISNLKVHASNISRIIDELKANT